MTLKLNGTNSEAAPAYAGDDADTGLQCGTNELKLVTGGSARATVDSSGNVGVGESVPLGKLHVKTADSGASSVGASADEFVIEGSGHAGMTVLSGTDQQGLINFADPADVNVGGITYNHSDNTMVFRANDAERMRILSGGGLTFNGDTAQANALDDYEEGTWTPTLSWGGTSATLSGSTYGYYTKIGNSVLIQFKIVQTARNTTSGNASMGGLPFAEGPASFNHGMVQGDSGINMPSGAGSIMLYINNTTSRWLYQSNTNHSDLTAGQCVDGTSFYGFAIYNT